MACLALMAGGLATAQQASAVTASCTYVNRQINFQEGAVALQVGLQKIQFHVCYNSRGAITSSSVSQDLDTAPAGAALGYSFYPEAAYTISSPTGRPTVAWEVPARGRVCLIKVFPICSPWEDFSTRVGYYSPTFIGPLPPNYKHATFYARCTNNTCKLRFSGNT